MMPDDLAPSVTQPHFLSSALNVVGEKEGEALAVYPSHLEEASSVAQ